MGWSWQARVQVSPRRPRSSPRWMLEKAQRSDRPQAEAQGRARPSATPQAQRSAREREAATRAPGSASTKRPEARRAIAQASRSPRSRRRAPRCLRPRPPRSDACGATDRRRTSSSRRASALGEHPSRRGPRAEADRSGPSPRSATWPRRACPEATGQAMGRTASRPRGASSSGRPSTRASDRAAASR